VAYNRALQIDIYLLTYLLPGFTMTHVHTKLQQILISSFSSAG